MIDFVQILAAAERANAAYLDQTDQARAAFVALGLDFLGQYQNASHQACLSRDADNVYLSISGTRFSQRKIGDLFSDIDLDPIDVGDGAKVTAGAYEGMEQMWEWAHDIVNDDVVWNVEGHSLGAWRTRYTPLFIRPEKIGMLHSFESPKSANTAYWQKYEGELASMVSIVNGRDCWVSWPFRIINDWAVHPERDFIWLSADLFSICTPDKWPGGFSARDHDMDLLVKRLTALAQSGTEAA